MNAEAGISMWTTMMETGMRMRTTAGAVRSGWRSNRAAARQKVHHHRFRLRLLPGKDVSRAVRAAKAKSMSLKTRTRMTLTIKMRSEPVACQTFTLICTLSSCEPVFWGESQSRSRAPDPRSCSKFSDSFFFLIDCAKAKNSDNTRCKRTCVNLESEEWE